MSYLYLYIYICISGSWSDTESMQRVMTRCWLAVDVMWHLLSASESCWNRTIKNLVIAVICIMLVWPRKLRLTALGQNKARTFGAAHTSPVSCAWFGHTYFLQHSKSFKCQVGLCCGALPTPTTSRLGQWTCDRATGMLWMNFQSFWRTIHKSLDIDHSHMAHFSMPMPCSCFENSTMIWKRSIGR